MKKLFIILVFINSSNSLFCQSLEKYDLSNKNSFSVSKTADSFLPYSIVFASIIYLLNPIILFENDRINLGFNKEFSVGFGHFGEHRISADYAYIFREENTQHFRLGYKYDYLLKDIEPSNTLQTSSAVTFGLSYFTDFSLSGISPEIGIGYSIRNNKLLIYPNAKFRFTLMQDLKGNLFDFSFGVMFGIANPFTGSKVRKKF
ncbi:MAG: hypothetical protein WC644_03870 [Ignavibacteria bacterium]